MSEYYEVATAKQVDVMVISVLGHSRTNRTIDLEDYKSRCVLKNEIHECILIDKDKEDKVTAYYLGFLEILNSGVLYVGMKLVINDVLYGQIVGFDYRHMPNHINIILHPLCDAKSGRELGLCNSECGSFIK